ncbi:MAG: oligoendopeptidase F family protein [Deltaproteobacteria bacterium]|nr:oligoendopeptidase F family protein [Deltaproteobacteria bacterium]
MRQVAGWLVAGGLLAGGVAVAAAAFVPDANMERTKVPDAYKWKLDALFKDDAAFEAGFAAASADREKLGAFKGKLADAAQLRACLEAYFKVRLAINKLTLYAHLRHDTDVKNTALGALDERAQKLMAALLSDATFIRTEVLHLDDKAYADVVAREAGLKEYRPYLDELRRRKGRMLSDDAERVLALGGDNLWAEIDLNELPSDHEKTFHAMLADLPLPRIKDEAGAEVQLTLANYGKYRGSPDRRVRAEAVDALFGTLRQFQHAFAGSIAGQVNHSIFLARARGYPTALEAYLDKDDIDPKVYRNLISAVHQNLAPLQRYVELRKKVMKVADLHLYDLYVPLVAGSRAEFSYEDSVKLIPEALAPLGPEYLKTLKAGLAPGAGWVDVFPHKDKASGAFCASVFGLHPFMKLNHFNDFDGLSTAAHELGHAMHSHLSMTHQPYVTSSYVPFIAEIASTFNEKLLSDHLVKKAKSPAEKLSVLNKLVESIRTTIYRQTLFSEFELAIHTAAEQGTPLTAEFLDKTYADLVRTYYGPGFSVGPNDGMEWAYIPHFYYKYYVYAYANGLSAGIALAELVQSGKPAARDAYLGMLKGGSSKPPLVLLKGAGVDLTRPDAVTAAARLMDRTLTEMEKLLHK